MKTGMNMLLWTPFVTEEHAGIMEDIKATGFDGIEFPLFDPNLDHYTKMAGVLESTGLGCTAVTIIPDQEHSPISEDPAHRQGAVEYLNRVVDCCAAVGAEVLCGPMYQVLGSFTGNGPTDDEKSRAAEVIAEVADHAKGSGVELAVEALNRFECYFLNTADDSAAFAKQVDRDNVGILYDTFHANIEEKDPVGAVERNVDTIKHVHISANDRGTPGSGHIPWEGTFSALKSGGFDGWMTIEAFGLTMPELAATTCIWRPNSKCDEEVYREGYKLITGQWEKA